MGRLNSITNDITKEPAVQLAQVSQFGQDVTQWSNNIVSQTLIDYTEPTSPTNESTTSTSFVNLTNFTKIFKPNNPLCLVSFHLCVEGEGDIGIFVNEVLNKSMYFKNTTFQTQTFSQNFNFGGAQTKIELKWRAKTGTITKANTTANSGLNSIQITSTNS